MKESLKTWFKMIPDAYKIVAAIFSFITIVSVAAIKIHDFKNGKINQNVRIDRWIKYDSLEHVASTDFRRDIMSKISNLGDSIRTTNRGVRKLTIVNSNMQYYMEKKVATKDGLLEVQKIFNVEKKNYSPDSYMIPMEKIQLNTWYVRK